MAIDRRHHNRLRAIRKNRGLSQQQLADLIGTTPRTIYGIESGKTFDPPFRVMLNAARVLDCDIVDLVDWDWNWTIFDSARASKPPSREDVAAVSGCEWWNEPADPQLLAWTERQDTTST